MTVREIRFKSDNGSAYIDTNTSRKFILADGQTKDGKDAFIFDKLSGCSIEFLRNNRHMVKSDKKVLNETHLSSELNRSMLLTPMGDSVKIELDDNPSVSNTKFGAEVTCRYIESDEVERFNLTTGDSMTIPGSSRIQGREELLESIEIDVLGVNVGTCRFDIYMDAADIPTPDESDEASDDSEVMETTETESSEEEDEVSNVTVPDITETLVTSKNQEDAISKLSKYETDSLLVAEVIEVLETKGAIPNFVETLNPNEAEKKLGAALVTHELRDLLEGAETVDGAIFAIDTSSLKADMKIYDEPNPDTQLAYFAADLKEAEEAYSATVEVPPFCGLRDTVDRNLKDVDVRKEDSTEESTEDSTEDSTDEMSDEPMAGTEAPETTDSPDWPDSPGSDEMTPDAGTHAAATPGAEAEMSDTSDESTSGRTSMDDVVDKLTRANSIEDAISAIEMTPFYKLELTDDVGDDVDEDQYTTDRIVDALRSEKGRPTGRSLSKVQHLNELNDMFLPAMRSLIMTEAIKNANARSGLFTGGGNNQPYLAQAQKAVMNLKFNRSDKIAGVQSGYTVDRVQFAAVADNIGELKRKFQKSDSGMFSSAANIIGSIPEDGGVRESVLNLQVNKEGDLVKDLR